MRFVAETSSRASTSLLSIGVGVLVASLLFAVGGCENEKETSDDKKSNDQKAQKKQKQKEEEFVAGSEAEHFRFALDSPPASIDPTKISGVPGGRVAFNIFEGLLMPAQTTEEAEKPGDLVRPGVAKDYEVSEDRKTYTFKLRKDAKWSNGEPVTAEDFVYSWKRTLLPGYPVDYAQLFYVIEGVETYNEEESESNWEDVGIKAPDEHTIKIQLAHPTPYFPELVAFYTFFPQPKEIVEQHREDWTSPENIVTNGPYTLSEHQEGKRLLLEKNDQYWDAGNVSIETAEIQIIEDAEELVEQYENEKLHWTGRSLTPWQVPEFRDRPGFHEEQTLGTHFVRVNVSEKDSFMSDPKFARALRLAVDREQIVEETLNGVFPVANSFVPDKMPKYESNTTVSHDPEKAKKLLEEMGVSSGADFGTVKLLHNKGTLPQKTASAVEQQWEEKLGFEIELEGKPWEKYLEAIDITGYELARSGWVGDYNDPMTFLDMWTTEDGQNDTGWSNETYDKHIRAAKSAKESPERIKQFLEAESLLLENGPVVPLFHMQNHVLVGTNVKGYKKQTRNIHLLKDLSVEDADG